MPMTPPVVLGFGMLTLGAIWIGPLPELAAHRFSAHMAMHMGVVAFGAPIVAFGLAGGRLDPVRRWPAVFSPIPASLVELVVVWGWHAPALHYAARSTATGLVIEQGLFLASGLLVWLSAFGGGPRRRAGRAGAGVVALLLTSMHMTLLGALFALAPRPLFTLHEASSIGALAEQHRGGVIMLVVGGAVYLAGGLCLSVRLLTDRLRPA